MVYLYHKVNRVEIFLDLNLVSFEYLDLLSPGFVYVSIGLTYPYVVFLVEVGRVCVQFY